MYLIVVGQVLNDSVEQEWRDGVQELDRGVAVKVARSLSILLILSTRQSHGKTKKIRRLTTKFPLESIENLHGFGLGVPPGQLLEFIDGDILGKRGSRMDQDGL